MDKCEMQLIKNNEIEMTDVTLVNEDDNQNLAHKNTKAICSYYNKGFCKAKDSCSKIHSKHICNKFKCRDKKCIDRHPVNCRYNDKCRRIQECLYMHNKFDNIDEKLNDKEVMIKKISDEIVELTIEINMLKEVNQSKENDLFKLNKDNEVNNTEIKKLTEVNYKLEEEIKNIKSANALESKMLKLKIEELEYKNKECDVKIVNRKKEKNITVDKYNKLADKNQEMTNENLHLNKELDERIEKHNLVIKAKHIVDTEMKEIKKQYTNLKEEYNELDTLYQKNFKDNTKLKTLIKKDEIGNPKYCSNSVTFYGRTQCNLKYPHCKECKIAPYGIIDNR